MYNLNPVRPVITNNAALASDYNSHPESSFLASACLTPQEASDLIAGGASFETVILVNGDGEEIPGQLVGTTRHDPECAPAMTRLIVKIDTKQAVEQIHAALRDMQAASMG